MPNPTFKRTLFLTTTHIFSYGKGHFRIGTRKIQKDIQSKKLSKNCEVTLNHVRRGTRLGELKEKPEK